jgi:M6 family metalloprotease-like protein/uncharacterized repeat protein (TIGR01451 family)
MLQMRLTRVLLGASLLLSVGALAVAVTAGAALAAEAAPNVVKQITQPDGTVIEVRLWGDEFAHGWETLTGYTVVLDKHDKTWKYARRDIKGELVPSSNAVGAEKAKGPKHLRPSTAAINDARAEMGAPPLGTPTLEAAPPWVGSDTDVLYIMVGFTDRACTFTPAQMQANLFGNTASGPGNLADFFDEVSRGALQLDGTVVGNAAGTGCAALGNTHAFYDTGGGSAAGLVTEAVGLVDGYVDFSQYDNDGNGTVDALGVIYAGGGPHDGCDTDDGADGSAGDNLWPHSSSTAAATGDGVNVAPYIINSEITSVVATGNCTAIQTIGLFAHEFGHSLGLPDLYDTDGSTRGGVGFWSTMASQYRSTVNLADTPPHYDPWSKWFLGWLTPTDYTGQNVSLALDRVEDNGQVAQFLANPGGAEIGGSGEYFLVENRQLTGFDSALPGCGIVVWHIDEAKSGNQEDAQTAGSHRLVQVEQADGAGDIDGPTNAGNRGDTGDPFPGSTNNKLFADTTTPSANLYSNAPSGVRVSILSPGCASSMLVNFGLPVADLEIFKSDDPDPVTAGNTLEYTVTVLNNGPGNVDAATVTDVLPAGVNFLSSSIPCANAAGTLTCSIGTLLNGASTNFQIQVGIPANFLSAIPASTTNISNTATISAAQPDGNLINNSVTISTAVVQSADLRVTKVCEPAGGTPAGGQATCSIYVDNLGPSGAQGVVLTDALTGNAPFTVVSANASPGGFCPVAFGPTSATVTCNLGTEPAGGRTTVTVVVTAENPVTINDVASVTSSTPDPGAGNNHANGVVTFVAAADLSVTKSGSPDPVVAGTNLTYTLSISNAGPSAAPNVFVTDSLPALVSFVSASPSTGSCQSGVVPGDPAKPLKCNLGTLANGASASIVVVVKVNTDVPPGTILVNNVDVASDSADPDNSDNVFTVTTGVITQADLAIVKTSDSLTYKPSTQVKYSITVTNNGPSKASHVVVTDNLPDLKAAIYQFDNAGCVKSAPRILVCDLGDMAVGQTRQFFVYVTIKGSKGSVSNTATVASQTTDLVAGNNSSTRVVTISGKG